MVPPFTHAIWTKHNQDTSIKTYLHIVMSKTLDEILDVVTVGGTWQKNERLLFLYCCGYYLENWASIGIGVFF